MSLAKKKQEKNQDTIRKLSLAGDNKECMDCVLKSTPYVVLDFGIFVCTFCSGIHRGFNYKAKGISMTNFEDKDVEFFETHGNKVASSIWRAKWDQNKVPKPKATDEKGIKDFINKTYVQKMWYDASGAAAVTKQAEDIPVRPIESIGITPSKVEVRPAGKQTQPQQEELFSFESIPVSKPQPTQSQPQQSVGLDFDFGFTNTQPTTQPAQKVTQQPQSSGFGDDNWGFDNQPTQQKSTQPQQKASINVDDLFAGFGSQPTQQTQGGWGNQQQTQGGYGGQQGGFGGQQTQGGWGQPQGGFGGQQQSQGWGQPQTHQGGFGQQNQGGWGQQSQGGFGGQQSQGWGQQTQGGFGGQQGGFGGQQTQGGWGQQGGQQSQGGFGGQQSQGWGQPQTHQQGGFGGQSQTHQQGFGGQQTQGGWGQQPQPARNLQDSPPPVKDPFSNLTAFGSTTSKPPSNQGGFGGQQGGFGGSASSASNPFDF